MKQVKKGPGRPKSAIAAKAKAAPVKKIDVKPFIKERVEHNQSFNLAAILLTISFVIV